MDTRDDVPQEMPKALVEDFLEQEAGTRAFLDELQKLAAEGRYTEVRERFREFAEHSQGAFFTVALSLGRTAQFFADVEAQMGAEVGEKLRDLEATYGTLAEECNVVRSEQTKDRLNPVTSVGISTSYRTDEEVPLVSYRRSRATCPCRVPGVAPGGTTGRQLSRPGDDGRAGGRPDGQHRGAEHAHRSARGTGVGTEPAPGPDRRTASGTARRVIAIRKRRRGRAPRRKLNAVGGRKGWGTVLMDERLQNQVEKEKRDLTILRAVIENGPIGIANLAERTGLPEHKVRYSLRMLENDGFVEPTPNGAVPADDIQERLRQINEGLTELIERLERIRDDEVDLET